MTLYIKQINLDFCFVFIVLHFNRCNLGREEHDLKSLLNSFLNNSSSLPGLVLVRFQTNTTSTMRKTYKTDTKTLI